MKTTADFLDAMRAKLDLPSDGRLADYLEMHRQHVSRYRTLGGTFDDEMSMKVAEILEIEPAYVVACMHHQREKNEKVKKLWERIAANTMAMAAVLAVVAFLPTVNLSGDHFNIAFAGLAGADTMSGALYIM